MRRRVLHETQEVDSVTDYSASGVRPAAEPSTPEPEIRVEKGVVDYTSGALPPPARQETDLKGIPPHVRRDSVALALALRNRQAENLTR